MEENYPIGAGVPDSQQQSLIVNDEIRYSLAVSARWARVIAVVGFVLSGFLALAALVLMVVTPTAISGIKSLGMLSGMAAAGLYLVVALLYFLPSRYLYDFSVFTWDALSHDDQAMLTKAFVRMKKFYRFCGILLLVIIALYILAIPISIFLLMPTW